MDVLAPGIGEIIAAASARSASTCSTPARRDGLDREHYGWTRPAPLRHGAARRLCLGFERTVRLR